MALASEPYRRAVLTLIVSRLLLAAVLVAGALASGWAQDNIAAARPMVNIGAIIFALTLAYLFAFRRFGAGVRFVFVQLLLDAVTVIALMILTGGAGSVFVVLQFVVLLAGALMLDRGWSLRLLAAVIALYGALVVMINQGWPPLLRVPGANLENMPAAELYYLLLLHLTGFILVTVIGERLARRVQLANLALATAERTFADYRAFADALVSGITDAVLAISRNGTVVFANDEAQRRFPDALGRPLGALLPELQGAELSRRVETWGSTTQDLEATTERPQCYEVHAFALQGEGMPGIALILRDVTNFKKLQAELQFKENLAAMGAVSARIAHEIRNPLAAISASAQLLGGKVREPAMQKLTGIIVGEADRLSVVLGDFLKYTRPEQPNPEAGDLAALLREIVSLASAQPGAKLRLAAPESLHGEFDADRIRQLLWNLISNARKAAPEGSEILIELAQSAAGAELAVEDRGAGVASEQRERIFSPFVRGFSEGSGLGLAIANKIAQGHGGRLELQPARHGPTGARFVLTLPRFAATAE